ncbi:MAG: PAS domain S-box protein, partial [Gemmatimonadota bacterium]|nr:PAS domain S-box protein [Gemmatimonadota bacterium]
MSDRTTPPRSAPALHPALEPYREMLRQTPLPITVVNLDGQVLMWSPESERLFGWKEAEVLGHPPPHVPPDAVAKMFEMIRDAAGGHPARGVETVRIRRDGTRVNVLMHTAALRDAAGEVVGVMGMFVDVTERRQIEMRLRNAQKMEAVGLLAGGVAHDFNNLLTAIKGFSSLLLEAVGDNQAAQECVDEIVRAAERASGLTKQLLAFSRRQLLRPELLDLNARLREMQPMLRVLASNSIELTFDLGDGVGFVMVDPSQLQQVVLNLVMNARDAIVERGRVVVRTAAVTLDEEFGRWHVTPRPGPYVRMDVIDTGTGMDPLTLTRAFDPFYTTKESGTGLGLATVFGIVKQSGGYVWPTSTSDKGTTFSVYLPRVEADDAAAELALPAAAPEEPESAGEAEAGGVSREAGPARVLRLVPGGPPRE